MVMLGGSIDGKSRQFLVRNGAKQLVSDFPYRFIGGLRLAGVVKMPALLQRFQRFIQWRRNRSSSRDSFIRGRLLGIGVAQAGLPICRLDLNHDQRGRVPAKSPIGLRAVGRNTVSGGVQIGDRHAAALYFRPFISRG